MFSSCFPSRPFIPSTYSAVCAVGSICKSENFRPLPTIYSGNSITTHNRLRTAKYSYMYVLSLWLAEYLGHSPLWEAMSFSCSMVLITLGFLPSLLQTPILYTYMYTYMYPLHHRSFTHVPSHSDPISVIAVYCTPPRRWSIPSKPNPHYKDTYDQHHHHQ